MTIGLSAIIILQLLGQVRSQSYQGTWTNDLSDIFTRQGLPEDLPVGTEIGTLSHVVPGQRYPRYTTTSAQFSVDPDSGLVTLRQLLNAKDSPLRVQFTASIPTIDYENTITVTVNILPVNHKPLFSAPNYTISVREDVPVGTSVYDKIYVTDPDSGPNGTVSIACLQTTTEWALACQSFSLRIQKISDTQNQVTVTVAKALDFSAKNSFTLQMRASDGGTPSLADDSTLFVIIENARDTRPVFLNTPIVIVVPEMAPPSTDLPSIQARSRTNSTNPLRIEIVSDPLKYFSLDATTSQPTSTIYSAKIRTNGNINRLDIPELTNQYTFVVKAVELVNGQESQVSSETTITVQILDINNNKPAFERTSYTANATEGMPFEATVPGLYMIVTDLDIDDNAFFVLDATSSPAPSDIFGVVPTSGQGSVGVALIVLRPDQLIYDDPNKRVHTVIVTARENKTVDRYSGQATVTVTVQNPNNQPTPFPYPVYPVTIDDNREAGNNIQSVSITGDPAASSGYKYAITDGNQAGLFQINADTGLISIAKPLNATANPRVSLTVSVTNRYGLVSYTTVLITIRDSRSQGPKFQQEPYITTVDELTTLMVPTIRIMATPLKADKVVRYSIVAGNELDLFNLTTNGPTDLGANLIMNRGVDYNETPNRRGYFELTIQAKDDVVDPLFTNTTVIINIRDLNNHAPNFLNNATYYGSVSEISPGGFSVVQVNATDLDAGENARISYIMGFGSKDNFVIDYTTGLLTVAPLSDLNIDRYGDHYNITVYAVDHGSPQRTGTAMIYITVNDSIYQTPTFVQSEYLFTVIENSPVDTFVGNVSAIDPDIGAKLMYLLDSTTVIPYDQNGQPINVTNSNINFRNVFKMDPTTGTITVAQKVSRQDAASIQFEALANVTNPDRPTPAARVKVTVFIRPVGSGTQPTITFYKPPMVNNELNVSIFETPNAGGPVTQFGAYYGTTVPNPVTDFRFGQTNDPNNLLTLNSTTGVLTVAKPINYDALPNKVLTYEIIARSPSPTNLSATATIHITVRSLDEGRPVFTSPYYNFSIREDAEMSAFVGQVKATLKIGGDIGYRLTGSPNDFDINPDTGDITVKNPLDAETRPRYVLTATTTDKSGQGLIQTVSALVYIYIIDVNERGPQFLGEPYNVVVYDTALTNTTLIQVQAIDPDISQTKVTYQITGGNDKGLFTIDPNTGIITPGKSFQNQSQPRPYEVQVTATDSGNPPLSTTTTVNILIRNTTNLEGDPIWFQPKDGEVLKVYEKRINETIVVAHAVSGRVNFPNVTYGLYDILANQETYQKFRFDPISGLLTTAVALNRTEKSSYELILQALDSGIPARSSVITVNVTVYSDAPPTFTSCPGTFSYPEVTASVQEKQPVGQLVTTVKACVFDKDPKPIYYYITAGNDSYLGNDAVGPPFLIGKENGRITTNAILNWYDSPILYINVTASTDSFGPDSALNIPGATVTVKIIINGTDANGPSFDPRPDMKEFCRGIGTQVTTGILDITEHGVRVIQYYAGDCDSPEFRNHTFTLSALQFFPPKNPNNGQNSPQSFTIEAYSGWVLTGETSYRKFTDGIFRMTITVTDSRGRSAISELTVYIIRESQRLRYTFTKGPRDVESTVPNFVGEYNTELHKLDSNPDTQANMVTDILRVHVDKEANAHIDQSDLCFHVREGQKVLSVDDVKTLYSKIPGNTTNSIYQRYSVDLSEGNPPEPCNYHVTTKKWSGKWFLWWLLIALALFIILITLILILCVCIYWPISRRNYFKSRPYVVLDEPPAGTTSEFEWQHSIHRVD